MSNKPKWAERNKMKNNYDEDLKGPSGLWFEFINAFV